MNCAYLMLLLSVTTEVLAQSTEVPYVFQAGSLARAAEVNENFATLVDAINANGTALERTQPERVRQLGTFSISGAPYNDQPIPLFLFQWAVRDAEISGAGGRTFGPITVAKLPDAFSPQLFRDVAVGPHFPAVRIELKASDSFATTYVLEDVTVSGFGATTVEGTDTPLETVAFSYAKLTISTTDAEGSATATACFDTRRYVTC